jgi:hypothetical protein
MARNVAVYGRTSQTGDGSEAASKVPAEMTHTLAKVGRDWWQRCYEIPTLSYGSLDESIFSEAKLLEECEKWGTSFGLWVGYARKG